MNSSERAAFHIISQAGVTKSNIMEAIQAARIGDFRYAERLINEAGELLTRSEKEHFKVISQEAREKNVEFSLLLVHAEDQLSCLVTLRDMAIEFLELYKVISEMKKSIILSEE